MFSLIRKSPKKSKETEHERICGLTPKERELEYQQSAEEAWNQVWQILHDTADWRLDKGKDVHTGMVSSKHYKGIGRVSKLQCHIDLSVEKLRDLIVVQTEQSPTWDPSLVEAKILQPLNDDSDIHYLVTREIAGGIIARRDYVSVRLTKTKDGITLSAGNATYHPDRPPTKKVVRGENKVQGMAFSAVEGEPNKCYLQWLMHTDMGGWLPQFTIDQGLAGAMMDFVHNCRTKVASMKEEETVAAKS